MVRGRVYEAVVELTYLSGTLPADTSGALASAVTTAFGADGAAVSVTVVPDRFDVVAVAATVREDNPLAAIAHLDGAVDRALRASGLFEEFDATGRRLRVAPREQAERAGEP